MGAIKAQDERPQSLKERFSNFRDREAEDKAAEIRMMTRISISSTFNLNGPGPFLSS